MMKNKKKILIISLIIIVVVLIIALIIFKHFNDYKDNNVIPSDKTNNDNGIVLNINKILPNKNKNNLLASNYTDIEDNLNSKCLSDDGNSALCLLYEIKIENNSSNKDLKLSNSIAFSNFNSLGLSWTIIDNYKKHTKFDANSFNNATEEYNKFKENYLLKYKEKNKFYVLVFVNENENNIGDVDNFIGMIRVEDNNGIGVTSVFEN